MLVEEVRRVSLDEIKGTLFELRVDEGEEEIKELADSFKAQGQIQPIVLRKTKDGLYVIAGARRLAAAKAAGCDSVVAIILTGTELNAFEIALSENLHRKEMTPGEVLLALKEAARRYNMSITTLLENIKYKKSQIHVYQKLLETDEEILDALVKGRLSLKVAYEIAKVPSKAYRKRYLEYALDGGATVQAVRNWRQQEEEAIRIAVAEEHGIEIEKPKRVDTSYVYHPTPQTSFLGSKATDYSGTGEHFVCLIDRQRHPGSAKRIMTVCEQCYNQILESLERES